MKLVVPRRPCYEYVSSSAKKIKWSAVAVFSLSWNFSSWQTTANLEVATNNICRRRRVCGQLPRRPLFFVQLPDSAVVDPWNHHHRFDDHREPFCWGKNIPNYDDGNENARSRQLPPNRMSLPHGLEWKCQLVNAKNHMNTHGPPPYDCWKHKCGN